MSKRSSHLLWFDDVTETYRLPRVAFPRPENSLSMLGMITGEERKREKIMCESVK